jgi:hypothetical protein
MTRRLTRKLSSVYIPRKTPVLPPFLGSPVAYPRANCGAIRARGAAEMLAVAAKRVERRAAVERATRKNEAIFSRNTC